MEHLALPDGIKHFIEVPYEAPPEDWYDDGGFLTFPARRGWTEEELRGGDDTYKDDYLDPHGFKTKGEGKEVERFFQTWLFFGLAIEVLRIGGVSVTTDDFLRLPGQAKARIVNTSKLPKLLLRWEEGIKRKGDLENTWKELNEIFEKAASVLVRFCPLLDVGRPPNLEKPRPWPVRDAISTTMIAMAFSLRRVATTVCQPRIDLLSPWPAARSEILTKRLQSKMCIADVATTLKQVPIDGHYFLAASPGLEPDEMDHHAKCVFASCLYEYDEDMYVTKHTTPPYHQPGCSEDIRYGGQLGPERGQKNWVDAVNRIIDKDAIPIALWVKGPRELWSVEYHFSGKRKPDYVAISHVWADGKGNPRANSLPECQIDKIQRLVEGVTWEGRKEVPSDPNLSNGVGFWMDTLCVPSVDKPRKQKAIANMRHVYSNAKATLVLDEWLQTISSKAPPLEIAAHLFQSNWLKRLWTHQEGFLPSALWFQFSDRSVELRELSSTLREHQSLLNTTGIYLAFPQNMNIQLVDQYTALTNLIKGVDKNKWVLYMPLVAAMSERKTARQADETICLATIVDFDLKPLLAIPSKPDDESAVQRMQLFLLQLGKFDSGIIFNGYERLQERGYRWAPKSLLNQRIADITYEGNIGNVTSNFEKVNGQLGLLVQYYGFRITFTDGTPSFATTARACAIHCKSSVERLDGKWFIIELPPNKIEWKTGQTYAVIVSGIPEKRGQRCSAIVALSSSKAVNDVFTVEHQSIASVRMHDTAPPLIDRVDGTLRRRSTKWLVV